MKKKTKLLKMRNKRMQCMRINRESEKKIIKLSDRKMNETKADVRVYVSDMT